MASPGFRALMTGIVDYAGLFPPAQLPLDESIRKYARYRTESESWMLGRFICPASRLAELSPFVDELFREGPPLAISALSGGGKEPGAFVLSLQRDLKKITAFEQDHASRVSVDVIEAKLDHVGDDQFLGGTGSLIDAIATHAVTPFYEATPGIEKAAVWRSIRAERLVQRTHCQRAGFKMRCGGLHASAFPSTVELASVIHTAADLNVPLKFTAGLHHPIRRFDRSVDTKMHGFLNVFVAGILASGGKLNELEIQRILDDEESDNFKFDAGGLCWRDFHASIAEIEAARRDRVISFGSCSFDEPRDDLRALGLL